MKIAKSSLHHRLRVVYRVVGLLGIILILHSGCSSFSGLNRVFDRSLDQATNNSQGTYRVEMGNMFGSPSIYEGQIDGPITVQTALQKSGAVNRYRNMDISVLRIVEETGRPIKMVVDYQPSKKSVRPEQDYAILPGDRIIIQPQQNGMLERLTSSNNL
jgi:hypothetical protein